MSKFHVNPSTGEPGKCTATVRECKYGGNDGTENHFETIQEAEKAGNEILSKKVWNNKNA